MWGNGNKKIVLRQSFMPAFKINIRDPDFSIRSGKHIIISVTKHVSLVLY